jgi:hypothetical protein
LENSITIIAHCTTLQWANQGGSVVKAYQVSHPEDESMIVFAETAGQARGKAYSVGFWDEFTELRVTRSPYADPYAEDGKVPTSVLLEHDWYFECDCFEMQDIETAIVINEKIFCEKCKPKGDVS